MNRNWIVTHESAIAPICKGPFALEDARALN
jgi:hypothetical protein